jgi:hypothetical protein
MDNHPLQLPRQDKGQAEERKAGVDFLVKPGAALRPPGHRKG